MTWRVLFTHRAQKRCTQAVRFCASPEKQSGTLDRLLKVDPYQQSPPYEALVGDLKGACSRRINIQHRLVYQVLDEERIVKVLRLWSHDA